MRNTEYELDDLDRELIEKVRLAVAYDRNGDPARDAIDEDEMVDAMRLLLAVLGLEPADLGE